LDWLEERAHFEETPAHELLKWLIPMFYAMFGFYVQSVCLHYATYSYVHKYVLDAEIPPDLNKYATLADPVEDSMGEAQINIHVLDSVAGLFPACFFVFSVVLACQKIGSRDRKTRSMRMNALQLWTKVMLCAGFLFIIKGIIGAVTTVPDSSGWTVCKARLGPPGVAWMKEEHSFWSMMILDFQWNVLWYHHPLRYCSDMMYSGHTFTVTLFALGLYELIRIVRPAQRFKKHAILAKMACLTGLTVITIGEQAIEIYAVEKSRFHYTSDIIVALIMTFLLYTNGVIAVASKMWSVHGWEQVMILKEYYNKIGKRHTEWDDCEDSAEMNSDNDNFDKVITQQTESGGWKHLVSGGDIFIPPCCIPCCCYSGREHIYSDRKIKNIIDKFVLNGETQLRPPLQEYLKMSMNLDEGVSMHQFVAALKPTDADPEKGQGAAAEPLLANRRPTA